MLNLGRTENGIAYYATRYSSSSGLLARYFELRYDVFANAEVNHYDRGVPNRYDKHPSTLFLIAVKESEDGAACEVIAGRRALIRAPHEEYALNAEITTQRSVRSMLPHLDTGSLCYMELGGMCVSPHHRGQGHATNLYEYTFRLALGLNAAFMIAHCVPSHLNRLEHIAKCAGVRQFVHRPDIPDYDGDGSTFLSFHAPEVLPLVSPEAALVCSQPQPRNPEPAPGVLERVGELLMPAFRFPAPSTS